MYVRQALFIYASHHLILAAIKGARKFIYSYFEKGCRKKCTRQSQKVLWVVLSLLFFKEIWKNGTWGHGHMFASAKGKHHKSIRQLQSSGTMYWSYPMLPFGIVACTFFPTTFLEIAVYVNRALCVRGSHLGFTCTERAGVNHPRWPSVTQSARSRWSYGKMEDCLQSTRNDIMPGG